jgi:hypothetical protein
MALKFKTKSKDEIPAELQSLYVERDGAWMLDVDGAVDRARVDEFRNNNITLANQLADHKRRFEGIDPDEARQLAAEKQRFSYLGVMPQPWGRQQVLLFVQPVRVHGSPHGLLLIDYVRFLSKIAKPIRATSIVNVILKGFTG